METRHRISALMLAVFTLIFVEVIHCSVISDTTECTNGPCGPGNEECGPLFGADTPQFHVRDTSCGENDPNFPLYDPLHKLYHHFWQAHLAEPANGVGRGPDIGHAVSADLVRWSHLPVAVWNDQPYDNVAIYTGSATIVNGVPTMVYPGLCVLKDWANCSTGTLLAVALPADHSGDPLLTNWSKPSYNPIMEGTQRDPTTAWQTAAGEWRLTNFEGGTYNSDDFVHWTRASGPPIFGAGSECPDFFTLPPPCKGQGCDAPWSGSGPEPTHIHKQSSGFKDWYTLGSYVDGPHGSQGVWTPTPGTPSLIPLDASTSIAGHSTTFYASKSFWDPVGLRRIYWGWALVPPASVQTLPRVTEWHAALAILTFNPLPELAALRSDVLFSAPSVSVPANGTVWLGDWANGAGNQSEFGASFTLPASASSFGVNVLVGADNSSTKISIEWDPVNRTAIVVIGKSGGDFNYSYFMPGVDLPGGDYNVTDVDYSDPHICQAQCTADGPKCKAYTYVTRPPKTGSCCLKNEVPPADMSATCTSGVKKVPKTGGVSVPLMGTETAIDVRVFVDNTFIEVYVMEGRLAFTLLPENSAASFDTIAGMSLFTDASGPVVADNVNVWHLSPIWISSSEVLAARMQ